MSDSSNMLQSKQQGSKQAEWLHTGGSGSNRTRSTSIPTTTMERKTHFPLCVCVCPWFWCLYSPSSPWNILICTCVFRCLLLLLLDQLLNTPTWDSCPRSEGKMIRSQTDDITVTSSSSSSQDDIMLVRASPMTSLCGYTYMCYRMRHHWPLREGIIIKDYITHCIVGNEGLLFLDSMKVQILKLTTRALRSDKQIQVVMSQCLAQAHSRKPHARRQEVKQ